MNKIVFYVIAFDQIKIQASQAPQNIPSFVKDINVVGRKMARNGHKMANSYSCLFFGALVYSTQAETIQRRKLIKGGNY